MKLKKLVAAIGVALSLVSGVAQADILRFQDDDIDFLLNSDLTPKTSGSFAVGDVLVSVFEMPTYTINGVDAIPAGQELTGIAVIQLAGGTGTLADPYRFTPYSQGFNAVSPAPDVINGGVGGGTMVSMWLNSTADFDLQLEFGNGDGTATNCTSLLQCLTQASVGTLLQVDGFAGDLDQFWNATISIPGGDDPSVVANQEGDLNVANFNAALTTFFNKDGQVDFRTLAGPIASCPSGSLALDGCIQGPRITGPILGGAGLNPALYADGAFARSDIDASKLTVPEPGMLSLVGLGLLGIAGIRRRRQ